MQQWQGSGREVRRSDDSEEERERVRGVRAGGGGGGGEGEMAATGGHHTGQHYKG